MWSREAGSDGRTLDGTSPERARRHSSVPAAVMLFLAVVGPGLIVSNVDNDAGGIYT